jgi:hypothetical protein
MTPVPGRPLFRFRQFAVPRLLGRVAGGAYVLAVALEGLWLLAALAVGGDSEGWLNYVIGARFSVALAVPLFWRRPPVAVVAAILNTTACVWTFYGPSFDFRHPGALFTRHSVDLIILAAAFLGYRATLTKPTA